MRDPKLAGERCTSKKGIDGGMILLMYRIIRRVMIHLISFTSLYLVTGRVEKRAYLGASKYFLFYRALLVIGGDTQDNLLPCMHQHSPL